MRLVDDIKTSSPLRWRRKGLSKWLASRRRQARLSSTRRALGRPFPRTKGSTGLSSRRRNLVVVAGSAAATAAVVAYFFDPDRGRARRSRTRQRIDAIARRILRKTEKAGRLVGAQAYGATQKLIHAGSERPPENDVVLKEKVESEVLGQDKHAKAKINVNVAQGVVSLRGELDSEKKIAELVQDVRKVKGVVDVENLVHLPGRPAPNKQPARQASKGS